MISQTFEHEQKVVEAILKDNSAYFSVGLESKDFQDAEFRRIYGTFGDMIAKKIDIDSVSLATFNTELSATRIADLEPVTAANVSYYAEALKSATMKRELVLLCKESLRRAEGEREMDGVIDDLGAGMLKIMQRSDLNLHLVRDNLLETINEIEEAVKNGGAVEGVLSGYATLDVMTNGFADGDLIVLAARPSIGKTTLAINMAQHMAEAQRSVAFFSCEMSHTQITKRLISSAGHLSHQNVRTGLLSAVEFSQMSDAASRIYEMELWIDDTPNIKFAELRNKCRMMKTRGVEIVFIDYLTLIQYGDRKTPRYERVGELVRELKSMARELSIPVVILSQLNREAEENTPSLANLRQSGEVEEHADVIMLMHRKRKIKEEGDDPSATQVFLAKHRNGPTGDVRLHFNESQTRFEVAVQRPEANGGYHAN